MSKIYIVVSSSGEYEDYRTMNEKAFVEKSDAEKYAKELDSIHNSKPSFLTDEWERAYFEAQDNAPEDEWDDYPITDENKEEFRKHNIKQNEIESKFIKDYMYSKGFLVTDHMFKLYEDWQHNLYEDWHKCIVEELELI